MLEPKCAPENCSNLLEMTESIRRVVLNDEIPPDQRFDIAPGDVAALTWALGDADGFFPEAVAASLGPGARIYDKPGDVANRDCLDVAYIVSAGGPRFLLATTVPHGSGGCDALTTLATGVLQILSQWPLAVGWDKGRRWRASPSRRSSAGRCASTSAARRANRRRARPVAPPRAPTDFFSHITSRCQRLRPRGPR
ncbi:MAG: hypothetical protein M3066_13540 [Actinomycetota bacterium]|nr:hypothetical protein [Actinomycetota bacterium]